MIPKKKLVAITIWLILNVIIFWFVGLVSSGYSLEGYLPGQSDRVEWYAPVVHTTPGDEPMGILYMVDRHGTIYYYIVWQDEYFSNSLIDKLYRFLRGLVYGGATEDIEVVRVNPNNGTFYFQTYRHTAIHGKLFPNGSCVLADENSIIQNCSVNGTHLRMYVVTWNHMLSLNPEAGTKGTFLPMRRMSPDDYVSLGMFRRTQKTIGGVTVSALGVAVAATLLLNGVLYWAWRRGYLTEENRRKARKGTKSAVRDTWDSLIRELKR
ncbi:hypothetical protein A3L09_02460 [Thermococcus profundus]|uniref:Uncharacterized protein n=1 Tax=Thermococcus profundus TaxID=49899 RepID=A0A2Z2MJR9_THEPR|nr:hypothetical protein [Thermococcus profundus]ASJ02208.1 hypothetical protein A3L09_02460 [Thermococcus profundus]